MFSKFTRVQNSQDVFLKWASERFTPGHSLPQMQPQQRWPDHGQETQVSSQCNPT